MRTTYSHGRLPRPTLLLSVRNELGSAKWTSLHREIIVCGDDRWRRRSPRARAPARDNQDQQCRRPPWRRVHRARAVVCAGPNDAVNLEIALLARQFSQKFAWWHVWPTACWRSGGRRQRPGAILNVADLAAPSVVEAVLSRTRTNSRRPVSNSLSGSRGTVQRHSSRDLQRPGPGGCDPRQELAYPGEVVPCPDGSEGLRRRFHLDDRREDELENRGLSCPPRPRLALASLACAA